jgi:hypothetical protein
MKIRNKRRHHRIKPKRQPKAQKRHPAYTVASLQKKSDAELVVIAKALGIDYRLASSEKKIALGQIILYIAGLVEMRRMDK